MSLLSGIALAVLAAAPPAHDTWTTPCGERAKAYSEKVAANHSQSSAAEWDRLGRDCLERGAYADGIRAYRRGLAIHSELKERLANLASIYAQDGRYELAYCLSPDDKQSKKSWEKTKRTARLCAETDKNGFLYVPADLRDK
jgi:hypothetical protein